MAEDEFQFGELLHHGNDLFAQLAGHHRHADELVILEAVADDRHIATIHQAEHGQQFRLAAGLEAKMKGFAVVEDFLHYLPLLVDLDGIDTAVAAAEFVFLDGLTESTLHFGDAMAEDIVETDQDGQLDITGLQLLDQFHQVDGCLRVFGRHDRHVAGLVDTEVPFAPLADAVGFESVSDLPFAKNLRVDTTGHQPVPSCLVKPSRRARVASLLNPL